MIKINLLIPYKETANIGSSGGSDFITDDSENKQIYIGFAK